MQRNNYTKYYRDFRENQITVNQHPVTILVDAEMSARRKETQTLLQKLRYKGKAARYNT